MNHSFNTFEYVSSYYYANLISNVLFGRFGYENVVEIDSVIIPYDELLLKNSLKPRKHTFLHETIQEVITSQIQNIADEEPDFLLSEIQPNIKNYIKGDINNSTALEIFEEKVLPNLVDEVFSILFSNRQFLKEYNSQLSDYILVLKKSEYPKILENDGRIKRCEYWPSWLKKGLFMREKGRCAICGTDLTNIFFGSSLHVDHIIPLKIGGTNDVTNLQILCDDCNLTKGGNKTTTSSNYPTYWNREGKN